MSGKDYKMHDDADANAARSGSLSRQQQDIPPRRAQMKTTYLPGITPPVGPRYQPQPQPRQQQHHYQQQSRYQIPNSGMSSTAPRKSHYTGLDIHRSGPPLSASWRAYREPLEDYKPTSPGNSEEEPENPPSTRPVQQRQEPGRYPIVHTSQELSASSRRKPATTPGGYDPEGRRQPIPTRKSLPGTPMHDYRPDGYGSHRFNYSGSASLSNGPARYRGARPSGPVGLPVPLGLPRGYDNRNRQSYQSASYISQARHSDSDGPQVQNRSGYGSSGQRGLSTAKKRLPAKTGSGFVGYEEPEKTTSDRNEQGAPRRLAMKTRASGSSRNANLARLSRMLGDSDADDDLDESRVRVPRERVVQESPDIEVVSCGSSDDARARARAIEAEADATADEQDEEEGEEEEEAKLPDLSSRFPDVALSAYVKTMEQFPPVLKPEHWNGDRVPMTAPGRVIYTHQYRKGDQRFVALLDSWTCPVCDRQTNPYGPLPNANAFKTHVDDTHGGVFKMRWEENEKHGWIQLFIEIPNTPSSVAPQDELVITRGLREMAIVEHHRIKAEVVEDVVMRQESVSPPPMLYKEVSPGPEIEWDPLGPAARPPYFPLKSLDPNEPAGRLDVDYPCRPGGPRLYDCVNTLSLKEYGVMAWAVIDGEDHIFDIDGYLDEDKTILALWSRWMTLPAKRLDFIKNPAEGLKKWIDRYREEIFYYAGFKSLRLLIMVLHMLKYLTLDSMADVLRYYLKCTVNLQGTTPHSNMVPRS